MKLQGGYQFSGGNSGIDLHAMTGWIPETQQVDLPTFDADRTWKRMFNGHNKGLCLVTIGTPEMDEKDELRYGLASNHAYAVLEIREVLGLKMLKLKNPWRHSRWRGKYSAEDLESWTQALREKLQFDEVYGSKDQDDGIFWIDYSSLQTRFSFLFMSWKPKLFPVLRKLHGCWKADADGPRDDSYNLGFNPQYVLNIEVGPRRRPAALWMLLSQHRNDSAVAAATTGRLPTSSTRIHDASSMEWNAVTDARESASYLTLHVYSGKQGRVIGTIDRDALLRTAYTDNPHTLVRFYVPPGVHSFALVLSQWEQRHDIDYTLAIFSMVDCTLSAMPNIVTPQRHLSFRFEDSLDATRPMDRAKGGCYEMQWELVMSNGGRPASLLLLLEDASDLRFVSYPRRKRDRPESSSVDCCEQREMVREAGEGTKTENIDGAVSTKGGTSETDSVLLRLNVFSVRNSTLNRTERATRFETSNGELVVSSGDLRPRFCYTRSPDMSTTQRYIVVASYLALGSNDGVCGKTTMATSSLIARRRPFVLRVGASEGSVHIRAIPPVGNKMCRVEFRGHWDTRTGTAAGSRAFGRYHSNPSVVFRMKRPGRFLARLVASSPDQNTLAINASLFRCFRPGELSSSDVQSSSGVVSQQLPRRHHSATYLEDGNDSCRDARPLTMLHTSLEADTLRRLFDETVDRERIIGETKDKLSASHERDAFASRLNTLLLEQDSDRVRSERDRLYTLSYARIRDTLIEELGRDVYERNKEIVNAAMQGRSGLVTGKVIATSAEGTYVKRSCSGVVIHDTFLDTHEPYILIASTFEPVDGSFHLILFVEDESDIEIFESNGMGRIVRDGERAG